jgi:polyisoprenyl-phosphate glycosyltransferase
MDSIKLCIILPCYNEEEVLPWCYQSVKNKLMELIHKKFINEKSRFCFIDDGSKDKTWQIIKGITNEDSYASGIKLSRNFGHQAALLAGLTHQANKFDCYITIDADLQDDIDAIDEMVEKFAEGNEVVYGVRNDRSSDTVFKRGTAYFFYKLMHSLDVETVYNHADFRLIGNKALNELLKFKEINLFLRGLFPVIGFKNAVVFYKRNVRTAGISKYPLGKMLKFAWEGITSFSSKPLRMILYLGLFTFIFALALATWAQFALSGGIPVWIATTIPVALIGAIQLISVGVIGEYIGKIYIETKGRPRFIIEEAAQVGNTMTGTKSEIKENILAEEEIEIKEAVNVA